MVSETRDFNSLSSLLYSSEDIRSSTEAGIWKSDNLPGYYDSDQGTKASLDVQAVSNFSDSSKVKMIATQHESSLFSSSLSELFCRKLRLSANNALYGHSVDTVPPHYEEERLFNSLEELEAQIIGNLLPNDDDLLSGVTDGLDHIIHDSVVDDMDELDLFSSVGGMDLGDDDISSSRENDSEFLGGACNSPLGLCNASITGEHPYSEHPSRTLFVRNINNDVENSELKALFEQFGDIHTLYTACKHHGSVMISYYDIRAAQNAMKAHQNRLFRCRKFDIHYLIPKDSPSKKDINQDTLAVFSYDSSVSNYELHSVFNTYGEIKEIRENPQNRHKKLIEFYDVRAASAALLALNRNDTTRKRLKVEPSRPRDPKSSPGQLNFDIEAAPAFHPRSLPECHDGLANGVHRNPPEVAVNINLKSQDRIDNMQFCQVNSNGRFMEFNECVFKSSGNGSCPLPGHHYNWNNSYQPPRMMWPNSPSYFHAAPTLPRLHGLPRSPSHMMSTVLSINNQHVPSVPLWDRQHTYTGESPKASAFHPSSLGNIQFSNNTVAHSVDFASHNIFSHFGGNCVDLQILPRNVGLHFHNHLINSFDTHKQRARSRRIGVSNLADKKQYELDIDRIDRGEDNRTTLMLKNIPNKYTSKMLLAAIDERHKGTYDFVYLPIDFKNKCNVGYAFINMTNPSLIIPFYQVFNGKKWEKFNSEKVASLAYARIQGKAALIAHFQNSSLMNEDKRCRPILFNTDGPNAGDEVPFPVSVNVRNKPGSVRNNIQEYI